MLLLEAVFALVQPAFLLAQFAADLLGLAIERLALLVEIVASLQLGLFLDRLGVVARGTDDLVGLEANTLQTKTIDEAHAGVTQQRPEKTGRTAEDHYDRADPFSPLLPEGRRSRHASDSPAERSAEGRRRTNRTSQREVCVPSAAPLRDRRGGRLDGQPEPNPLTGCPVVLPRIEQRIGRSAL